MFLNKQLIIQNITYILIVFLILIGILLIIHLFHFDFNTEIYPKKLLQVVTIENLQNKNELKNELNNDKKNNIFTNEPLLLTSKDFINTDLAKDFCKSFQGSSNKLNEECSRLTKTNCKETTCCVLLNGEKCLAGSAKGPTFLTDTSSQNINIDFYYYQNKCYGGSCPTIR